MSYLSIFHPNPFQAVLGRLRCLCPHEGSLTHLDIKDNIVSAGGNLLGQIEEAMKGKLYGSHFRTTNGR